MQPAGRLTAGGPSKALEGLWKPERRPRLAGPEWSAGKDLEDTAAVTIVTPNSAVPVCCLRSEMLEFT